MHKVAATIMKTVPRILEPRRDQSKSRSTNFPKVPMPAMRHRIQEILITVPGNDTPVVIECDKLL
jgi:hypothetical protein